MGNSHQVLSSRTIAGLALAGMVSGLLTIVLFEVVNNLKDVDPGRLGLFAPGTAFGLVLSAYFLIFLRIRAVTKLAGFVAASIGAYISAYCTGYYSVDLDFTIRDERGRALLWDVVLFCAGTVGAFVLLGAAQLLFCAERKWSVVVKRGLAWSLAGGSLAVAGSELGGSLGKVLWLLLNSLHLTISHADVQAAVQDESVNSVSLFALWQAGMAAVLGSLISKSSAAQPERQAAASA
jgi:hypothetical protein